MKIEASQTHLKVEFTEFNSKRRKGYFCPSFVMVKSKLRQIYKNLVKVLVYVSYMVIETP